MEPETEGPHADRAVTLQILHVPGCPGAEALRARLAALLAGRLDILVTEQVVATEDAARELGMTGSPTILADGTDLFARPGLAPSLSCRLYPAENGRLESAPTTGQLRRALRLAG